MFKQFPTMLEHKWFPFECRHLLISFMCNAILYLLKASVSTIKQNNITSIWYKLTTKTYRQIPHWSMQPFQGYTLIDDVISALEGSQCMVLGSEWFDETCPQCVASIFCRFDYCRQPHPMTHSSMFSPNKCPQPQCNWRFFSSPTQLRIFEHILLNLFHFIIAIGLGFGFRFHASIEWVNWSTKNVHPLFSSNMFTYDVWTMCKLYLHKLITRN